MEHVTPYIHKNVSEKILVEHVKQKINNSRLRLTVDTIEDFDLIKILLENYNAEHLSFSEIENILLQHPEIAGINSHIEQKEIN